MSHQNQTGPIRRFCAVCSTKQKRKPFKNSNTQADLTELIQTLQACMEKWNTTLEQLQAVNKKKQLKTQRDYSNYTCYNCFQQGHISRNCPNKTTEKGNLSSNKQQEN